MRNCSHVFRPPDVPASCGTSSAAGGGGFSPGTGLSLAVIVARIIAGPGTCGAPNESRTRASLACLVLLIRAASCIQFSPSRDSSRVPPRMCQYSLGRRALICSRGMPAERATGRSACNRVRACPLGALSKRAAADFSGHGCFTYCARRCRLSQ